MPLSLHYIFRTAFHRVRTELTANEKPAKRPSSASIKGWFDGRFENSQLW
jgi:hypothetical protein